MNFRRSRARSRRNSLNIMISTEKWRSYSNKLSLQDTNLDEDSEDDIPKTTDFKGWLDELFLQKNGSSDAADQDVEINLTKKQTLILSTLVPDEILLMENLKSMDSKRFVGVLLMADVSGYTALSEKYNNMGKGGTYRLTFTLNTYLGSLIEVIYNHGGDIIKFAGDAFLALWKTDKRTFLCHTIHTAIACALIIQHSYGSYETDVKVNLKVKLAISAGNLIFAPIGSGIDMNYIIVGLPVLEAKVAESLCTSGEVKLTPTAWGHCYSRNYDHVISSNGHVTIKSILYDPHEKDISKPFLGFAAMIRQVNNPNISLEDLTDFLLDDSKNLNATAILKKNEWLSLRKNILKAEEKNMGAEIRNFMIRPVLTQIDAHQPLEYLTEMRQVSVLFITLKPRDCPFQQLITIVNNSYQITCEIVYKSMGCVNKIILFDKDIMILAIFGLRGFKHESEAQAALKCAYSVKKSVSALDGVLEVSIGVTTGQVYCGVVGHPLRREFTVIGTIVNKAARFMCSFRNMITCDEATYVKSKMSSNGFTLQPPTQLKGIVHSGKIFEYTEDIRLKELFDIPLIPPLLNRDDEMRQFEAWLNYCDLTTRSFDAFLLIGESRIGKTRLLEWMARFVRNKDLSVCYLSLTSIHSATPYLALSQIFEQIIGLKDQVINGFEKEEKIVNILKYYSEDLCYLNSILKVRFAYHEGVYYQDETVKKEKAKYIFKKIIESLSDTHIIFLDDLQNLDSLSWEFVSILIESLKIFTVMTLTKGKYGSMHYWLYSVFTNSNIKKIILGSLSSIWTAPLACQILDVHAVSNELCDALNSKCNGIPGLIESFIVRLFSNGALEIVKIDKNELDNYKDEDLRFPNPILLHPIALECKDQVTLNELLPENATEDISICLITKKDQLNIDINVQNVDALIMMQIDSLTPYQQLLLKIASVIGNVLSRDLLENIMYENNPLTTAKAIKRLFAMRILSCANFKHNKISTTNIFGSYIESSSLVCDCLFEYDPESYNNLPKYAFCKVMKFKSKNSRKIFYELLPLNQKKEFHSRIVNYLENIKQKCLDCGGVLTVVQSTFNLQPQISSSTEYSTEYSPQIDTLLKRKTSVDNILETNKTLRDSFETRKVKSESLNHPSSNNVKPNSDVNITNYCDKKISILKTKSCEDEDIHLRRRSTKRVTMTDATIKEFNSEVSNTSTIFDNLRDIIEAKSISDWHRLGVVDSEDYLKIDKNYKPRKSLCINLEKGISTINFKRCTCAQLNIIIYEQLIKHAQEAEMKTKMLEFLIHFCYLNVLENNFNIAIPKLEEAENICLEESEIKKIGLNITRFLGKIYSLKAASFLLSGKLIAAKVNIEKAAKIYNFNLKNITNIFHLRKLYTTLKLTHKKYNLYNILIKKDFVYFLNIATVLYSTLDDEKTSRTAAFQSIYLVQKVDCNIIDICDSFTNAIQMHLDRGITEFTMDLERMAYKCLENAHRPIRPDELFAIGKLIMTIFRSRSVRTYLAATIRSGFRALVISRFLGADEISVDIIPDLFYLLLSRCRIEEAVKVAQLLLKPGENFGQQESETWYYALCIDMILDGGFQLESPYEISSFAEFSILKGKAGGEGRRRLIVGLWTYWLRASSESKAKCYETESLNWLVHNSDEGSMKSIISAMRLAEGMLESLARKVDDLRKIVDLMELRSLADRELTKLEKDARTIRAINPRWLLLKANSLRLSGRQVAATLLVKQRCIRCQSNFVTGMLTTFIIKEISFTLYPRTAEVVGKKEGRRRILEALGVDWRNSTPCFASTPERRNENIDALEEARKINNRLEAAQALAFTSNSQVWHQNARNGHFLSWDDRDNSFRTSWHKSLYKIAAKTL